VALCALDHSEKILPILDSVVCELNSIADNYRIKKSDFVAAEEQMQDIDQCVQECFKFDSGAPMTSLSPGARTPSSYRDH
jgi:hypothetical protein